jgi:hypothetical protein
MTGSQSKGVTKMTEEIVFATPIVEGRIDDVRRFCEEMGAGARAKEHDESRRRMGFRSVKVWVQRVRNKRAVLIAYWEAEDIERVVREMAESQEPFDVWFREGVLEFHGVDLSQGTLRNPPEKFLDWQAD